MSRAPSAADRWQGVIDDFHRSGLKQAEFCRRRGLSLHTFRKYLYGSRLTSAPTSPAKFLPLTAIPSASEAKRTDLDLIVLVLPYGRRVAIAPGFDAATLRRLLDALDDAS